MPHPDFILAPPGVGDCRPMPLWHINGTLTRREIRQKLYEARDLAGFGGVAVVPQSHGGKKAGTKPPFLTDDYFDCYREILNTAVELKMQVILYDDEGFPSGSAGGRLETCYPQHTGKRLDKIEKQVMGPRLYRDVLPHGRLMAAVAMHDETWERIDLRSCIRDGLLDWLVPQGPWKVMIFMLVNEGTHKDSLFVDYLDPDAVQCLFTLTYDQYARHFGDHFASTIQLIYMDDVGFWRRPRAWTGVFNEIFRAMHGYDPEPYYPALWYDIGPDTSAIRNAFHATRAELLAEGYPRIAGQWAARHGLKATGHPPGNYAPNPVDMSGDIFTFYRHMQIPLLDCLFRYGHGQDGFKLTSSAADVYGRPVVAAEVFGAFKEDMINRQMLYRVTMELFTRGVNFIIPHGLWYDPRNVTIPPLISPENTVIAAALPDYSAYVARTCDLLQGGQRVSDIGIFYPIEEIAGWHRFDCPETSRQGWGLSAMTDYLEIGGRLTRELHRDFTFIHPELFLTDHYTVEDGVLQLNNTGNRQAYLALIITGCTCISARTLRKIQLFYERGGVVVANTQLPYRSAERGRDDSVRDMIRAIFGVDPLVSVTVETICTQMHPRGGRAVFIPKTRKAELATVLETVLPNPDVVVETLPPMPDSPGHLSYIHKVRHGRDIFFFANSSDKPIDSHVLVRGRHRLQQWNPHQQSDNIPVAPDHITYATEDYTRIPLQLAPVSSLFFLAFAP